MMKYIIIFLSALLVSCTSGKNVDTSNPDEKYFVNFQGHWADWHFQSYPKYYGMYGPETYDAYVLSAVGKTVNIEHILDGCKGNWDLVRKPKKIGKNRFSYQFIETITEGKCLGYNRIILYVHDPKSNPLIYGFFVSVNGESDKLKDINRYGNHLDSYTKARASIDTWMKDNDVSNNGSRKNSSITLCTSAGKQVKEGTAPLYFYDSQYFDYEKCKYKNKSLTYTAAYYGQIEIAKELIKRGGSIDDAKSGTNARKVDSAIQSAAIVSALIIFEKLGSGAVNTLKNTLSTDSSSSQFEPQNKPAVSSTSDGAVGQSIDDSKAQSLNVAASGVHSTYRENNITYIICNKNIKKRWQIYHDKYGQCSHPFHFGSNDCNYNIKDVQRSCD